MGRSTVFPRRAWRYRRHQNAPSRLDRLAFRYGAHWSRTLRRNRSLHRLLHAIRDQPRRVGCRHTYTPGRSQRGECFDECSEAQSPSQAAQAAARARTASQIVASRNSSIATLLARARFPTGFRAWRLSGASPDVRTDPEERMLWAGQPPISCRVPRPTGAKCVGYSDE
jgi:hypothetical protein